MLKNVLVTLLWDLPRSLVAKLWGYAAFRITSIVTMALGGTLGLVMTLASAAGWIDNLRLNPLLDGGIDGEQTAFTSTIVRVIDGDTVVVKTRDGLKATGGSGLRATTTVRMLGIDAPELHPEGSSTPECGAQAARRTLELLLPAGTKVRVVLDTKADHRDRYGRTLAYVELADRGKIGTAASDAGRRMVADGWVGVWFPASEPEPTRVPDYRRLERAAARDGLNSAGTCGHLGR